MWPGAIFPHDKILAALDRLVKDNQDILEQAVMLAQYYLGPVWRAKISTQLSGAMLEATSSG